MRQSTTRPQKGYIKTLFDVLGRVDRIAFCSSEGTDTTASTLTGDTVLSETVYSYDDMDQVIQVTSYERNHNATATGPLSGTPSDARIRYVASWFDDAHRTTHSIDFGTNGGASFTRPTTPYEPNTSANYLVTKTAYNDQGLVDFIINNSGVKTQYFYDALDRKKYTVENYDNFNPSTEANTGDATDKSKDRVTKYVYNAESQITQQVALDPDANGNLSDNQTTTYNYGGDDGTVSPIYRKDLLIKTQYPDGDPTNDNVKLTYYADSSVKTRKDQRQTELTFVYDARGLRKAQKVTSFGTDSDNTVQSITYGYDDIGRLAKVTSHGNVTDDPDDTTNVKNQTKNTYNGYGQLITQDQDIDSAVVGGSGTGSKSISYEYDTGAGQRLKKITYPNGRVVYSAYSGHGGIDDLISRSNGPSDNSTGAPTIAEYSYLGGGTVVNLSYPTPTVTLTRINGSGAYDGLDILNRVSYQRWKNPTTDLFKINHGYDNASNRLYAENEQKTSASQVYTYDNLNRVKDAQIGLISTSTPRSIQSQWQTGKQTWTLDALGNQTVVDEKQSAALSKNTPNAANELDTGTNQRMVKGNVAKSQLQALFNNSANSSQWVKVDSTTTFDVNTTNANNLTVTALPSGGGPAILLFGADLGPSTSATVQVTFPTSTPPGTNEAGLVFGYKSINDYWLSVYDRVNQKFNVYQVLSGTKTLKLQTGAGSGATKNVTLENARNSFSIFSGTAQLNLNPSGFPSGRYGLYTTVASTRFGTDGNGMRVWNDAENILQGGRWISNGSSIFTSSGLLLQSTSQRQPIMLRSLRADRFELTFKMEAQSGNTNMNLIVAATDQNNYDLLQINHYPSAFPPTGSRMDDGKVITSLSGTGNTSLVPSLAGPGNPWYVRVIQTNTTLTVKYVLTGSPPSETTWSATGAVYTSTAFRTGGMIGFVPIGNMYINNLTIKSDTDNNGSYETMEHIDAFSVDGSGYATDTFTYDAAGNLTYDGGYKYSYDAWNRLRTVTRAYRSGGSIQTGSVVSTSNYDGLGRRISKAVTNSADWNCTYAYYHDGQRVIEIRNGSDQAIKQQVWGLRYADNQAPGER